MALILGSFVVWLLEKFKELTVTWEQAQKETSQSLQTPSTECCIHPYRDLGWILWRGEAPSPRKEARSYQRQNNHKTRHSKEVIPLCKQSLVHGVPKAAPSLDATSTITDQYCMEMAQGNLAKGFGCRWGTHGEMCIA